MEALLRRCGFRPQEQALPAAGEEPARAREAGAAAGPLSLPQKWVRGAPDGDGENALAVAHAFLRTHVRPGAFALDATAGNGHDTLFLCRLVGAAGRVLAFDVQPQAVENTNARLRENGCGQVGRAVLDSHANLAAYAAPGSVDAAVFNLGYLPGGDHGVFTTPGVSVPAMRTALELLRPGGVMTVCVYYGGPQGMAEKDAVLAFLTGLPPEGYRVSVRDFSGRPGCPPIPVCIEKRAW
ncbi:methyltransferase domain-containing protein [Ruthenibacterium lactatiformans]|nr:methyltransferase domain-containing protein [Ruthenibacterium lactatiformans]MTS13784.1 methyltransferase domain-containing protein [Ruthenibacterium lactatiformans]MTS17679.1 methyltransferase domain-containing protein [Ruthenibacterium lactatiformans]MTS33383.1 methyltransferase domain-containing protein [Ruthenibacterium lactatiformans]MTS47324.1 methyltransferase domain-containing protein [Ruthenibacterium lactatiformans]